MSDDLDPALMQKNMAMIKQATSKQHRRGGSANGMPSHQIIKEFSKNDPLIQACFQSKGVMKVFAHMATNELWPYFKLHWGHAWQVYRLGHEVYLHAQGRLRHGCTPLTRDLFFVLRSQLRVCDSSRSRETNEKIRSYPS